MENNENLRDRSRQRLDLEKSGPHQVTSQQNNILKEFVSRNSGVLEGRFFGPLQDKQADKWLELRNLLNKTGGAQLSVSEWKKVWSDLKREMKIIPSLFDCQPFANSQDEDLVVLEERKVKTEDSKVGTNFKSEGRHQMDKPISDSDNGDNTKNRDKSLSPVSSNSSFDSSLSSITPPKIGNIRQTKSYNQPKYKRSPSIGRSSSYRRKDSYRSRNRKSRSPSRNRSRSKRSYSRIRSKSRSISKGPGRSRYRSKSPGQRSVSHKIKYPSEKDVWDIYRKEVDALEAERWSDEKLYEKNPEKHPDYKNEWKKFYKNRVSEILSAGRDPKLYNFESEWAFFWKWRMDEILKADFEAKKESIRKRLRLPNDEPKTHAVGLISTLRYVTAVEEQLGSLGPRVNTMLSQSVALQRLSGSNPDSLLCNQDNVILLETVREKLLGQIQSKIVRVSLKGAVLEAIESIDDLLKIVPAPEPSSLQSEMSTAQFGVVQQHFSAMNAISDVTSVGNVDRVVIAQQIADALVKQGKTDVTESELQELVNAVLCMAKTQTIQEKSQESKSMIEANENVSMLPTTVHSSVVPISNPTTSSGVVSSESATGLAIQTTAPSNVDNSAFNMLMSVVQAGAKKNSALESINYYSDDSETESAENKNSLTKFTGFKSLSKELKNDAKVEGAGKETKTVLKENLDEFKTKTVSENFKLSQSQKWHTEEYNDDDLINRGIFKKLSRKNLQEVDKSKAAIRQTIRKLSPFSSRKESSNPTPLSKENEAKDLSIIGAWDSDSDIDLDTSGKTKIPAYEKINIKLSPDKESGGKLSPLFKSKRKVADKDKAETDSPKNSVNTDLNSAIDDLMGSLKKQNTGERIPVVGHSMIINNQTITAGQQGVMTNPNYAAAYYQQGTHPQVIQSTAYNNVSASGYTNQPNQLYSQYAQNYNSMTATSYPYSQNSNQLTTQAYYGGGAYNQTNPQYPYYNYQAGYTANPGVGTHSTNYQQPYQ